MTNSIGDISSTGDIYDLREIYNLDYVENDVNSVVDSISISQEEGISPYDAMTEDALLGVEASSAQPSVVQWGSSLLVDDMETVWSSIIAALSTNYDIHYSTKIISDFFNTLNLDNLKNRLGAQFFSNVNVVIDGNIQYDLENKIKDCLRQLEDPINVDNKETREALEMKLLEYMIAIEAFDNSTFSNTFLKVAKEGAVHRSKHNIPDEEQNEIDVLLQMVHEKKMWLDKIDELEALISGETSLSAANKENFLSQLQTIKRLLISDMPAVYNMIDLITQKAPDADIEAAMVDPADKMASSLLSVLHKIAFEDGDEGKFKLLSAMLTIHTAASLLKTLLLDRLFIEDISAIFIDSKAWAPRDMLMDSSLKNPTNDYIDNDYIDNVVQEDPGREQAHIRPKFLSLLYQQLQADVDRKYPKLSDFVAAIGMDVDKISSMFEKPMELSIGHKIDVNNEIIKDKIDQKLYIERLGRQDPFLQRESLFNVQNVPYAVLTYSNALHLAVKKYQQPESQPVLEGHEIQDHSIEIHDETMKVMIKLVGETFEYMEDFLKSLYERPVDTHILW